jgi:predicted glycoside hydrolase/deacetylase ChbG (UPF0249 family)
MNKEKILSVNCDDFGLSNGINRGVEVAYKNGILTDASIMPNTLFFEEAIEIIKKNNISIAAHINLIRGKMITGIESYKSVINLWKKSMMRKEKIKIEKEIRAQIEKLLNAGLKINQINSEKHSHFFPPLFQLWSKIAEEYNIRYIRFIREFNTVFSLQGLKANLLSSFSLINKNFLKNREILKTDFFCGILITGNMNKYNLKKQLENLNYGHTELMVHLGFNDSIDKSMGNYFINNSREKELKIIIDDEIKNIIKNKNIILRDFGGKNVG